MTLNEIKKQLSKPLPGIVGQREMMPSYRNAVSIEEVKSRSPKEAGVVVHLFQGASEMELLFMKRVQYPGTHSGQISFPGGGYDASDGSLLQTALRETHEEVGVQFMEKDVEAALSWLYIPPSNYYVEPYVVVRPSAPQITINPEEVDRTFSIPLGKLISGELVRSTKIQTTYGIMTVPAYHWEGEIIWGATAMITAELVALLR
jgi:8-oxo-dGTP pyrophosphatase MutT (NUDIX family)